jgi:hypothetical protein
MIGSRPIPRGDYRYKRKPKPEKSLRYDTILNGAVRVYKSDQREVCQENYQGRAEYRKRVEAMIERQDGVCALQISPLCPKRITPSTATFGHDRPRGNGAAFRDDRITDENGLPINHAECWHCNGLKGSKRLPTKGVPTWSKRT